MKFWQYLLWISVLCALPLSITAQATPTPAPIGLTIHVVQRDEDLTSISVLYGTTSETLLQLNALSNPTLQVGQRLIVPAQKLTTGETQSYVVQAGETLEGIAQRFNLSIVDIIQINGITDPSQIYAGQIIELPAGLQIEASAEPRLVTTTLHTIQRGETLFNIARNYGLTVDELVRANNIANSTLIYAGQQLIIPLNSSSVENSDAQLPAILADLTLIPVSFIEGETGIIRLSTTEASTLTGTFLGRELRAISSDDGLQHTFIIGIPLFTEANIYPVQLSIVSATQQLNYTFNLRVLAGSYGTVNLNISQEMEELLAPAVDEFEMSLLERVTTPFNPVRAYSSPLSLPAAAPMNAPFGTRRSYNGGAVNRTHNGADFASAPGTPIYAAASGRIVMADLLNIRGNTIVIDHGLGVYTLYAHLSAINVSLGEDVSTGQIIGTAGSTGRVTGPHLHWEVWVNGVAVNPMQWTRQAIP